MVSRLAPLLSALISLPVSVSRAEVHREMRIFDLRFVCVLQEDTNRLPEPPLLRTPARDMNCGDLSELSEELIKERQPLGSEQVAEVVRALIDPDSWQNDRNVLETKGNLLVVVQTPEVLARVSRFLGLLERSLSRVVAFDAALVPPEALEKAAPGALDSAASPWLSQEAFDEAVKAAGDRAMLLSAVGRLGVTLRLMPHTISRHLMDYDLNQTGVIPAVQSARSTKRQGIFAESVVTSVPREGWLRLDVRVGHEKEVGEPEIRPLIYGDAELPVWDETHLATCFLAPEGKTVVLGFFTDSPLEAKKEPPAKGPSWALLARVRVFNASLPLKLEGDDVPEIMDLSGLLNKLPGRTLKGKAEDASTSAPLKPEDLLSILTTGRERGAAEEEESLQLAGSFLFVVGASGKRQDVRGRVQTLALQRLRPITVELIQGEAAPEELGALKKGALLEQDWPKRLKGRSGFHARLACLAGGSGSLGSVEKKAYVSDLSMVSGGTATTVMSLADPEIRATGAGLLIDARCDLVPGTEWGQLHVGAEYALPPVFSRQAKVRSTLHVESVGKEAMNPITLAGQELMLDLPDEDLAQWQHLMTVPLEKPMMLNILPHPSRPGKSRILIGLVREHKI